jgi:hypothetical protein
MATVVNDTTSGKPVVRPVQDKRPSNELGWMFCLEIGKTRIYLGVGEAGQLRDELTRQLKDYQGRVMVSGNGKTYQAPIYPPGSGQDGMYTEGR